MKRRAQPWLGTLVDVTIADALTDEALRAPFRAAFVAIAEVHRLMSFHDQESDVSRINRAACDVPYEIHPHTFAVIECALSIAAASDGLFDIGCAPRLVEWGYLPAPTADAPDHIPVAPSLNLLAGNRIIKSRPGWIDLSGIAKGYAVDQAIATLQRSGIASACVNAGGDMRAYGDVAYPVSIRNPDAPSQMALHIWLRDEALATSGIYFSRKMIEGRNYSPLINGKNGNAVTANMCATVRAGSCMVADALTKVVMASADAVHPALQPFGATAFMI